MKEQDKSQFVQHTTATTLQKQKVAWDLFLAWVDRADDEVMTTEKKKEFHHLMNEEPVLLPFHKVHALPRSGMSRAAAN